MPDTSKAFLAGGGELADRIAAFDWSKTPLGPIEGWPASIKTTVALMLRSPVPLVSLWGEVGTMIYNDAYSKFAGARHPQLLGSEVRKGWPEVADFNDNIMKVVLGRGETLSYRDFELVLYRSGSPEPEHVWFNLDYSPVLDETGKPIGVLAIVNEITEAHYADIELKENQQRLNLAMEAAGQGAWTLELATMTLYASTHCKAIFGHGANDRFTYADLINSIAPGDRERMQGAVQTAIENRTDYDIEYRVVWPDKQLRWVHIRGRAQYDADGRPARMFGVSTDITERKASQLAVSDYERRYSALFNSMDEGFCIIQFIDSPHGPLSDYVHIEANPAYAKNAGIENVVGQKVREMVPAEADGWVALYGEVLRTGKSIRFERELVATGRYLELAAFRIEPASLNQVAVLFQDITARKRAEAELRQLNETLEARVAQSLAERRVLADIVEGTNAFVQVVDQNYRWIAINGAAAREFERIFGVKPHVGDNMLDMLNHFPDERDAVHAIWARALAGQEFTEISEFGTHDRRSYEMRFSTLRNAAGERIGAYQFVYDVTERLEEQRRLRQTEEALRQAQKMEAVGQLTGGLAHDFNNLLTGISGSLELINTRISQGRTKDIEKYVTAAQGAARRAAAVTHRLLAFSRRQTLAPKAININQLVNEMEEIIRRSIGPAVAFEVVGASGLWTALVDPPQLESALLNLCLNARDAMPNGGRITIETANKWMDERAAREHDMPQGQYISLCVTDTGTGMPPEVVERVFEPFFTTKPLGQGTGLGLSMIYGFARQSGGQVRIYSEVGKGTTVCIYLPRHYGALEADETPAFALPEKAKAGETVLIVDDEPTVRMLVTDILGELGYTAIEASDSATGLKILQSNVRIDLLISDVGLPGGMNGRQMADAARIRRPELKVLFITGYAENAIVGNGQLEPDMQLITKPFSMDVMAARIRELIASPGKARN